LGSLTLKWPVGVVFIATNQIVAVGKRLLVMGAPDSPVRHRTVSGAPPRHPLDRVGAGRTLEALSSCGTGQSGATPDSPVPL
jgi:hypothetical protein